MANHAGKSHFDAWRKASGKSGLFNLERSLQDYIHWVLKYFWIILLTTILGGLLGAYLYSISPELYQSWAVIEVKRIKREAAELDERERIRMTGLAEILSVIEKLNLPGIYQRAAESEIFTARSGVIPRQREFRLPWAEKELPQESPAVPPQALGALMSQWVTIRWRENTMLVDLLAKHSSPEIARDTLASMLSAFESSAEESIGDSSDYALDYITSTAAEFKESIARAQASLNLYHSCLALRDELRNAGRDIVEMEKRYLPKWPPLVEAKELERLLRQRFSAELDRVLELSPSEREDWKAGELSATGEESDLERVTSRKLAFVEARSSILKTEIENDQLMYDDLMSKLKTGTVAKGFVTQQFEIAQPPTLPQIPVEPKLGDFLQRFLFGGAAFGLVLVLFMSMLDPTVRTVGELESETGINVMAAFPEDPKMSREMGVGFVKDPHSHTAEAVRTLRTNLVFLGDREERKSTMITSSIPGEGKSWIAVNLAAAFAHMGERTLLVEGDLRRPTLCESLEIEREGLPGITDFLIEPSRGVEPFLYQTEVENLFFAPSGSKAPNPSELLSSRNVEVFFEGIFELFDRVVVDTAPVGVVSDALPLARLVNNIVFVYRVAKTPRIAMMRALSNLAENKAVPVGIAANRLPQSKRKGSYGYYYSYHGGGYDGYDT